MLVVLIAIIIIMLAGWGISILMIKEINSITRQLEFIKANRTNMIITSRYSNNNTLKNFTNQINAVIIEAAISRRDYITKEENLKDTLTSLSHDIRTPLTSLDGYFQLFFDASTSDEQEQYQKIIKEQINCLRDMLDTLFTYTKLQNNSYKFDMEMCSVNKILLKCLFGFYQEFKDKKIEPKIQLIDEQILILGNENALKRIFQNLIKNCMEHGNGDLNLIMEREENKVIIMVVNHYNDEGINIEGVFDMFYKADRARSHTSTGLGLAIAKELVEKIGGSIEASIFEDEFKIEVCFPVAEADAWENT